MKNRLPLLAIFVAALPAFAADTTVSALYDSALKSAESEIVGLAEAMPADKYNFAPPASLGAFQNVRTFALQVKHLSAVLYEVSAAMLGEKAPVEIGKDENGPADLRSKDQIVKFMKDAFAYAHKAVGSLTAQSQLQMVKSPFGSGEVSRGSLAGITTWHSFDHYGQMVVYARMNGVVPPASR